MYYQFINDFLCPPFFSPSIPSSTIFQSGFLSGPLNCQANDCFNRTALVIAWKHF